MPVMFSAMIVKGPAILNGWQVMTDFVDSVPEDAKALLAVIYISGTKDWGAKPYGAGTDWEITRSYSSTLNHLVPAIIPLHEGKIHIYYTTSTYVYAYGYLEDYEVDFLDTPFSLGTDRSTNFQDKVDLTGSGLPSNTTGIISTTKLSPLMSTIRRDGWSAINTISPYTSSMKSQQDSEEDYILGYTTVPIQWMDTCPTPFNFHTTSFDIALDDRHSAIMINPETGFAGEIYPKNATGDWTTRQNGSYHFRSNILMGPLPGDTRSISVVNVGFDEIIDGSPKISGYWINFQIDEEEHTWAGPDIEYSGYIEEVRKVGGGFITIHQETERGEYSFSDPTRLQFYLSGGAINTDADNSLGGAKSGALVPVSLNSLFNEISGIDVVRGRSIYRCIYLSNTDTVNSAVGLLLWVDGILQASSLSVGVDPAGVNGTAQVISDKYQQPTGVDFVETYGQSSALPLALLTSGDYVPVWIKLTPEEITQQLDFEEVKLTVSVLNNGA